jgi:hypothetical protein
MVEVKFKPADVGTVADGSVTNVKLAPGAVTNDKVASAAAIDSSKLADVPQRLTWFQIPLECPF